MRTFLGSLELFHFRLNFLLQCGAVHIEYVYVLLVLQKFTLAIAHN